MISTMYFTPMARAPIIVSDSGRDPPIKPGSGLSLTAPTEWHPWRFKNIYESKANSTKHMAEPFHVIGKDVGLHDSIPKALGSSGFAADMKAPYMLYGRIVRSSYPRARVRSIDTAQAEKAGAVCLTYMDVPRKQFNPRLASTEETTYKDWRVLTDEPN
jgi:hypothetical protein